MKALLLLASALMITGCCGQKDTAQAAEQTGPTAGGGKLAPVPAPDLAATARVAVYRTRTDLQDRVPVTLSDDGSSIVSYPHPSDLRTPGGLPVPTELEQGWLLDRRGIGMHVAFLKMTYADYAAMKEAPSMAELEAAILDPDPITDMCDCGPRNGFKDPVVELERIIRNDSLYIRCKRLK
ncbi:MAG: hypothetical protein ABIY71_09955 [Flavobacteriales bacterium]